MFHALSLIHTRCRRIEKAEAIKTGTPRLPAALPAPHAIYRRLTQELASIGLEKNIHRSPDPQRCYSMVPLWEINPDDGLGERVVEIFPRPEALWNEDE